MSELRDRMEATLALAEAQLAAQHRAMGLITLEPREYKPAEVREIARRWREFAGVPYSDQPWAGDPDATRRFS